MFFLVHTGSFQVKHKYGAFRFFKKYVQKHSNIYSSLVPPKFNDVVNVTGKIFHRLHVDMKIFSKT